MKNFALEDSETIHIRHADLQWSADRIVAARSLLSVEEIARADRFIQEKHRRRFIAAHATLYHILSHYLKKSPKEIEFTYDAHGKPLLKNSSLFFNMSDSHECAFYAIRQDKPVGVDVEYIKMDTSLNELENIAQRFFSAAEIRQLMALPADQRRLGFYKIWVLKEAYLKAIGHGLSFPLSKFTVDITDNGRLIEIEGDPKRAAAWFVQLIDSPPGYYAAVAGESPVDFIVYDSSIPGIRDRGERRAEPGMVEDERQG